MPERLQCLLVNPGSRTAVYQGLAHKFSAIEPPSLAALFATYLMNKGHSCEILDAHALQLDANSVADLTDNTYNPVLVVLVVYGFQPSASTQNMPAAGEIAREIRERRPDIKIMMTGTHPAALPERTLAEEAVDFVCAGEGPDAICSVLNSLKAGSGISKIIRGENVQNLDAEMPGAAWDSLPMNQYRAHNWHCFQEADREPYASIHTTLGCPYACTFCCINAPFGGPGYRRWSPATVGAELEFLVRDYGVRNVKIVDEMFVLHRAHVLGVCDEIMKRGLGDSLNIWAYARVDTVKDEYLDRLRAAGFRWLALGIESGSKHVRDGAEKGRFGNDAILQTVKRIQDAGINVIGNYIFGLPDDTHSSMEETLSVAVAANCEFANFYSAMAYPGSKLHSIAKENRWALPEDPGGPGWIGYSQHAYETLPLPTAALTAADVLRFRDKAFSRYFGSASYLSMVERKFGAHVRAHVVLMTQQDLKRRILQ